MEKSLASLEVVLKEEKTDIVRDSAIKRFEYSYEISIKTLRRYLEFAEDTKTSIDELTFRDLIRVAAERGCITTPELWFDFRKMRNITSHAYDEEKAESIYTVLPSFLREASALLDVLRMRAHAI